MDPNQVLQPQTNNSPSQGPQQPVPASQLHPVLGIPNVEPIPVVPAGSVQEIIPNTATPTSEETEGPLFRDILRSKWFAIFIAAIVILGVIAGFMYLLLAKSPSADSNASPEPSATLPPAQVEGANTVVGPSLANQSQIANQNQKMPAPSMPAEKEKPAPLPSLSPSPSPSPSESPSPSPSATTTPTPSPSPSTTPSPSPSPSPSTSPSSHPSSTPAPSVSPSP